MTKNSLPQKDKKHKDIHDLVDEIVAGVDLKHKGIGKRWLCSDCLRENIPANKTCEFCGQKRLG